MCSFWLKKCNADSLQYFRIDYISTQHYVGGNGFPRGYFEISTWRFFIFHVGKKKFFGGIK